jgi:class 3 adenylate cyclase
MKCSAASDRTAQYAPAPDPPPAVHRSIVCVDVEKFTDPHRTHPHQLAVRRGLYDAVRDAFARSRVPWHSCYHEDRGDGMLVLVPPEVPKEVLVTTVPRELARALAAHNRAQPSQARIRLRLAVHAGEVHLDDFGVTGAAVNSAFRLLGTEPLKTALAGSAGLLALIASRWFFEEVIRHTPASAPASYRHIRIPDGGARDTAWICLPDAPYPPADPGRPAPELTPLLQELAASGSTIMISASPQTVLFFFGRTTRAVCPAGMNDARPPAARTPLDNCTADATVSNDKCRIPTGSDRRCSDPATFCSRL